MAAYDAEIGLRLGEQGERESPEREEPRRPGHAPLRAESWVDHAQRVAAEGRKRLEGARCNLTEFGFLNRFGLDLRAVIEATEACALLHDLGKLTRGWQQWAEATQRSRDPAYGHPIPLAHTDFDPDLLEDRQRERGLQVRRPPHAPASAYYGRAILPGLLNSVPERLRAAVASTCAAAIVAHHGGWWTPDWEHAPLPLCDGWQRAVELACGIPPDEDALGRFQGFPVDRLLALTTGPDSLPEWWPVVAYLTRTLRLSDQRATSEWSCHD
jgi:CRISPR-associated endonuclease Cas3-HD